MADPPAFDAYTSCRACKRRTPHASSVTSHGFYLVICGNPRCNAALWRCASCPFNVLRDRRYQMVNHQEDHGINDDADGLAGPDVDFGTDNEPVPELVPPRRRSSFWDDDDDPFDSDDEDGAALASHQLRNIVEEVDAEILAARPAIVALLQGHASEDPIDEFDRDEQIFDELAGEDDEEGDEEDVQPLNSFVEESPDNDVSNEPKVHRSDLDNVRGIRNQVFWVQWHNEPHGAIRGLVQRAAKKSNRTTIYSTFAEADFMFSVLENLVDRTASERERYLSTIKKLMALYPTPPNCSIEIPTDMEAANKICLRNKYSIFANFPCEEVFEIDGHACIRLDDKLDAVFARGTELSFMLDHEGNKNFDGLNGTDFAQDYLLPELKKRLEVGVVHETCFGHLVFWSDSFLLRHTRQRDNSIWLFVVRICPPPGLSTSKHHTFCLAFGTSKLNHERVIAHYMAEVNELMKGKYRYYGKTGVQRKVNTSFGLGGYIADGPERDKILHRLHLGNYGKRSRHAGRIDTKKLPSCDACFWATVASALNPDHAPANSAVCGQCCNWDQFTTSDAKLFDKTAGTSYPNTCSFNNPNVFPAHRTANENSLITVEQNFPWLVQAAKCAFYEHSEGEWLKSTTTAYLGSAAIDTEIQERVCDAASRAKANEVVSEEEYIPEIWQLGFSMDLFVEATMHLLGHGVLASILELTENVLTENRLWKRFIRFANEFLTDISSFRLDWCKVKTLPKANWLGEDCFGYGRLMLFLYSQFFLRNDIGGNETILGVTLVDLKRLLCSCHVMLSLVMTKKTTPREEEDKAEWKAYIASLDTHIKIFLSCCHRFCEQYYVPSVAEFWFNKANFVGLLNLPEQVAKFGPVGLLWDGTFERFLQGPKRGLLSARKTIESLKKRMAILQKMTYMDAIREDLRGEKPGAGDIRPKRYQGVRIYPSKQDILTRLANRKCLSCFCMNGAEKQVMVPYVVSRESFSVVLLEYEVDHEVDGCGLYFAKFKVREVDEAALIRKKSQLNVDDGLADQFCLMLPFIGIDSDRFRAVYSLITHEWLTLADDGGIAVPSLCETVLFSHENNV